MPRQSDLLSTFRGDCGEAIENLIFLLVLKQKESLTTLLTGSEVVAGVSSAEGAGGQNRL